MEPRKHYFAKIPTIAIFIVMAMSGPLGVLLFILKGIDQKVREGGAGSRPRPGTTYRADLEPELRPERVSLFTATDVPTEAQKSAKQWHKNIATLCTILGAVFLLAGVTNAVDVLEIWRFIPGLQRPVLEYRHDHWRRRCTADRPADEKHPQAGAAAG